MTTPQQENFFVRWTGSAWFWLCVVLLIAYQCWPVLQKTIERGSRANTPLETPLWIPQGIWFAGWAWFALSATALSLIGIAYFARGKRAQLANTIGLGSELDQ